MTKIIPPKVLIAVSIFVLAGIAFFACKKSASTGQMEIVKKATISKIDTLLNTKTKDSKNVNLSAKYPGACPYPCGDSRCVAYTDPSPDCPPPSSDITTFRNSPELSQFNSSNPTIASKIYYPGAQVRVGYNQLLNEDLKTIHLPVIESTGDTSAVIIGVPDSTTGGSPYLIFYQYNGLATRNSSGYYYGEFDFDLFNSSRSCLVQINNDSGLVSDSMVNGPRWITNYSGPAARAVWPTGQCIDNVMDTFWGRCTGFCRFWCRATDTFSAGTCTGGQYLGAAVWCSLHNNNYSAY